MYSVDHRAGTDSWCCVFVLIGRYECYCPRYYAGVNCQVYDVSSPGGVGDGHTTPSPGGGTCPMAECGAKAGDGNCDVSVAVWMIIGQASKDNQIFKENSKRSIYLLECQD